MEKKERKKIEIATFHCGVDSPVRIASLTIAFPASKSISAGTDLSSTLGPEERPIDTISPGKRSVPESLTHLQFKTSKIMSIENAVT